MCVGVGVWVCGCGCVGVGVCGGVWVSVRGIERGILRDSKSIPQGEGRNQLQESQGKGSMHEVRVSKQGLERQALGQGHRCSSCHPRKPRAQQKSFHHPDGLLQPISGQYQKQ